MQFVIWGLCDDKEKSLSKQYFSRNFCKVIFGHKKGSVKRREEVGKKSINSLRRYLERNAITAQYK